MKLNIITRTAVAALLLVAGLQTANAQGIRVHYKNGNVTDVPVALFDRFSPYYKKTTIEEEEKPWTDPDVNIKVEPLDLTAAKFVTLLQQEGMPLNIGLSAPTVNGTFSVKPISVVKTWSANPDEDDELLDEDEVREMVFKFSGQSGFNVWIDTYDVYPDGPDSSIGESNGQGAQGIKSFIMGSGSKFTAAFIITAEMPAWDIFMRIAYIISGEVSGSNLKDVYVAVVSLDKQDNVEEYGIGKDGDGVSYATTWAPLPYTDDSRSLLQKSRTARRMAARKNVIISEKEEYGYTVYKTDGTQFGVTQDELDYIETYEGEFDQRITQQIPQQYLEKMSAYMPIYAGNTPPTIEGTFTLHPYEMVYTSDSYKPTEAFGDNTIDLSDQNRTKNTVNYQNKQGSGRSEKTEMVVLGKDDKFTIFAVVSGTNPDATYKMAEIVSGTMTTDGIKDVFTGILMLEKNDPNNKVMKVGTYRIFKDGDGLATPSTWSSRSLMPQQSDAGTLINVAAE